MGRTGMNEKCDDGGWSGGPWEGAAAVASIGDRGRVGDGGRAAAGQSAGRVAAPPVRI